MVRKGGTSQLSFFFPNFFTEIFFKEIFFKEKYAVFYNNLVAAQGKIFLVNQFFVDGNKYIKY